MHCSICHAVVVLQEINDDDDDDDDDDDVDDDDCYYRLNVNVAFYFGTHSVDLPLVTIIPDRYNNGNNRADNG